MYLECQNLSFSYPGCEKAVIHHLSFLMKNPGFNAVFGPSGAGKTSLAAIIAGMEIRFEGKIVTENINTVFYSYNLERLPGWSGIGKHLDRVTPEKNQELKEKLIEIFDLKPVLSSRFSMLSMGQQNRINLIRYLVQDFDLLILDESLANVDEKLRETIILAIKELFEHKMFLYISHNLMEVSKFCRQILVFSNPLHQQGYSMVQGQDYRKGYQMDKKKLDETMLEIMNAF